MDNLLPSRINDIEVLIRYYYQVNSVFTHCEICSIINNHHRLSVTVRQLKYLCKKLNFKKKNESYVSNYDLEAIIANELDTSSVCVGYRQMTEIINLRYNLGVAKDRVRKLLKIVDPEGVALRSRKVLKRRLYDTLGPNDVWHLDGNDKLKRWGFCIHGCVDGFSRKVLWMQVASTNNDSLVVANYFLRCVKKFEIAPKRLRMDKGTENIYCEDLQQFFTNNIDGVRYGASTRNQRIEAYWSRLKKYRLSWWINFFKAMCNEGLYLPHLEIHQEVLLFVFLPIIEKEINEFVRTWNARVVRQSAAAPGGRADLLFSVPERVGFSNQGIHVDKGSIRVAESVLAIQHCPIWKNRDIYDLLHCYVNIHGLVSPISPEGGIDQYVKLISYLVADGIQL